MAEQDLNLNLITLWLYARATWSKGGGMGMAVVTGRSSHRPDTAGPARDLGQTPPGMVAPLRT